MFKPRSILQLTITGFLAVAGPLIFALVVTANQLDELSDRSQRAINQSVEAMRASRVLIEQATSMERNFRQYMITGDGEMLNVYWERRTNFSAVARQLEQLKLDPQITRYVGLLLLNDADALKAISAEPVTTKAEALFPRMLDTAYEISRAIDAWTNNELASIAAEASATRDLLRLQALALVSAALVLAAIFTALITRPLLQVDRAINQLGSGAYATPVTIRGPKDIMRLGERLDWLRERLNKLEQQRTSFLRHVSHELKTPLAAIHESSSLLVDGAVGKLSEDQLAIIRIQGSNCQRLQRLIEDLLRFNADSFSVLNVMPQPVRLDQVVDGCIAAHELALKARHLVVTRGLDRITVLCDAEQLRVVVDNLVTNALRFSPAGGVIDVKLYQRDQTVVFEIFDQGPGIAPDETAKIFHAFYQGRAPDKELYKGTGLGLAIAEEYAKANHGSIEALASECGGHFRLLLPLNFRRE